MKIRAYFEKAMLLVALPKPQVASWRKVGLWRVYHTFVDPVGTKNIVALEGLEAELRGAILVAYLYIAATLKRLICGMF